MTEEEIADLAWPMDGSPTSSSGPQGPAPGSVCVAGVSAVRVAPPQEQRARARAADPALKHAPGLSF